MCFFYKKDGQIAYFKFLRTHIYGVDYTDEEIAKIKEAECSVEVTENKMTSEECGDKEGEVVNKILNAIENKTYFDY